jgi:phage head maturation protease
MGKSTLSFTVAAFAVDQAKRSLSGVLIPYGEVSGPAADPVTGKTARYSFAEGTVMLPDNPADIVLNYGHDGKSLYMQVGVGTALATDAAGVQATFRIARTPEGDRVLALAEDGVLKAFSAEVEGDFTAGKDGVQQATAAILTGAAVVPKPAFKGAHITSVAASAADDTEGNTMKCTKCDAVHAAGVVACDPATLAAFTAASGTPAVFSKADGDKLMADVAGLTTKLAALENVKIPVGPGTAQFQIKEEPIYRFAGSEPAASGFDFATDILAAGKGGDGAALARLQEFTAAEVERQARGAQFADQPTTTADVAAINPSQYRPDMFLGQAPTPTSPLYDTFVKGSLSNVTPFFWSKLDRVNTDVGVADHVEDTNPESRDLVTAAGATVTPVPVSGRVHITREVADQGGNPVVSGLVWSEFQRSFSIARETKTAALIQAAAITELGSAIAAGATGLVAGAAVEAGLVGLQFLADGFRFTKAFGHVDLYTKLALAVTGNDEKVYPILNPTNRSGTSTEKYSSLDIAGYNMYPAASLGATGVNSKSIVADPNAVHVWASGLTQLDKLSETVAGWDMAVFAYFAGVVYDVTGLRKITYTLV